MPLITHRGAAGLLPANSLQSIKLADSYSPAYIEVDVNVTADGILIVHHGFALRFMRGVSTKETYEQIKCLTPDMLTVEELLSHTFRTPLLFDVKFTSSEHVERFADVLDANYSTNTLAFTSPHASSLLVLQRRFPGSRTLQSQPYHHGPVSALELARKYNFSGVMLNKWWLSPFVYHLCKAHGKIIGSFTIDSVWGLRLAHRLYPSLFIVSNRPDRYRLIDAVKEPATE